MKKWIFRLLKLVGVLAALYVVIAFFSPDGYQVERKRTIAASDEVVFELVANFSNWDAWSPWAEKDSTAVYSIKGEDGTVGCVQSWEGDPDLSGKGQLEIIELIDKQKMWYELTMLDYDMKSTGGFQFSASKSKDSIVVSWADSASFPFFARPFALFMDFEEMIGADFERGLEKLDSIAVIEQEKLDAMKFELTETIFPTTQFFGRKKEINIADIDSAFFAKNYGIIGEQMFASGAQFGGMPGCLSFNCGLKAKVCEVMPVIPVVDNSMLTEIGQNNVEGFTINESKAVQVDYYGDYENLEQGHKQALLYLRDNELKSSVSFEQFVSDPTTISTMDSCLTRIYYILD